MTSRDGDSISREAGNTGESMIDSEVVPSSSLVEITPILRVASEVEPCNPRVAYLCRFYAFQKSRRLDPHSIGRGVHEFKTALLKRLERENEPSLRERVENSDALEIRSFYQHYYKKYIQALQSAAMEDHAKLTKAYQTASIIFEVVKAVNMTHSVQIEEEVAIETQMVDSPGELMIDGEAVPSSLVEIFPILRVADEVEASNARVAYLCRLYALQKSGRLDPPSIGHDVCEFKTALLKRLEREDKPSLAERVKKSDALEMGCFYQHFYKNYIQALQTADKADSAQHTKVYQTASILFEVVKAVNMTHTVQIEKEVAIRTQTANDNPGELMIYSDTVPSALVEIVPILHVANEVEASNARVAYLCRFYAFEKSRRLDPRSIGRGVHEFRTALLKRLEREDDLSLAKRVERSDGLEMRSFYQHYCLNNIQLQSASADKADRSQLTKADQTASILFEVLKAVNMTYALQIEEELAIRTQTANNPGEMMIDSEAVPLALDEIVPILLDREL